MRPGLIETADTPEEAEGLQTWWAAEVVTAGLAADYGVSIRIVRLSRGVCWGIFIEPQDPQREKDDSPPAPRTPPG
jgi:hypothetical protein